MSSIPSLVSSIASLGPVAGAVAVAWLSFQFMSKLTDRAEKLFTVLYDQMEAIAKDKGMVIRENTRVIEENTQVMKTLERSVCELSSMAHGLAQAANGGSRPTETLVDPEK